MNMTERGLSVNRQKDISPRWVRDMERLLPIRSQFVISGNIRDNFIASIQDMHTLVPLLR